MHGFTPHHFGSDAGKDPTSASAPAPIPTDGSCNPSANAHAPTQICPVVVASVDFADDPEAWVALAVLVVSAFSSLAPPSNSY